MAPYILIFILITILSIFAESNFKKGNKKEGIFLLIIIGTILVLFGGLRNVNLGYDTKYYVIPYFEKLSSGYSLQQLIDTSKEEVGYISFFYYLYKIYPNVNFIMSMLETLLTIPFLYFAYNYKNKCSLSIMIVIFYCTLYLFSFNIMRQCVAIGMLFMIFVCLKKKKYMLSLIFFLIGLQFHNSMSISLLLLVFMWIFDSKKINKKIKILLLIAIPSISIILLINYKNIISLLYSNNIITRRYYNYIMETSKNNRQEINIEYSILLLKTYILGMYSLYFMNKNIARASKEKNYKWLAMSIFDYLITFMSFKLANTDRLTWCLFYPSTLIFYPQTIDIFKKDKTNRTIGYIIIVTIAIAYMLEKLITNQYKICPYFI